MKLYDRLYYKFYRMLLRLDDMFSMHRETPRAEIALLLSLLMGLNIITIWGLLTALTEMPVISAKKIYTMLMLLPVFFVNLFLIFYKKRYKKIEARLLPAWKKSKHRNITIALAYIGLTIVFFCLTVQYIKSTR